MGVYGLRLGGPTNQTWHLDPLGDRNSNNKNAKLLCEIQGVQRILVAEVAGRNVGDHDRATVATKRILEQPCQLRISIWYKVRSRCESIDAVPRSRKRICRTQGGDLGGSCRNIEA